MAVSRPSASKQVDMSDKLNPLAIFQYVPASPKLLGALRRLNAMLSTYSGVDRSMMLVQVGVYGSSGTLLTVSKVNS